MLLQVARKGWIQNILRLLLRHRSVGDYVPLAVTLKARISLDGVYLSKTLEPIIEGVVLGLRLCRQM